MPVRGRGLIAHLHAVAGEPAKRAQVLLAQRNEAPLIEPFSEGDCRGVRVHGDKQLVPRENEPEGARRPAVSRVLPKLWTPLPPLW